MPLSLPDRSLQLVVFRLEAQLYALPLDAVERVLPMVAVSSLPQAPSLVLGVINWHGQVVPVLDLRRRLGYPACEYGLGAHLLVARTPLRRLALPVDAVLDVWAVAATAVTAPQSVLPGISHVAGTVALGDGLLFIHNLDTCLALEEERQLTVALEGMEQ